MEKEQPKQVQEKKQPIQQQEPTQLQELIQLEAQQPLMQVEDQLFTQLLEEEFMQFEEDIFRQLEEEHRKSPLNLELQFIQSLTEIFMERPEPKFLELEKQQPPMQLEEQLFMQLPQEEFMQFEEDLFTQLDEEHGKSPLNLYPQFMPEDKIIEWEQEQLKKFPDHKFIELVKKQQAMQLPQEQHQQMQVQQYRKCVQSAKLR